ncbi:SIR2 family protein [Brachybacterium paraconglomeratum]
MNTPQQRLVNAFNLNHVALVTGAGVSAAIGTNRQTASWVELLRSGIRQVEERNSDSAALLNMRLEQNPDATELSSIAERIRYHLGSDFARWISLSTNDEPRPSKLPQLLADLGVPILTTNYDTLLDDALNRRAVTWTSPDEMRKIFQGASTDIGHLHGVRTEAESIVLTTSDYARIRRDKRARMVQDSAFSMYTFLFIGAGNTTDDPNFRALIESFSEVYTDSDSVHFRLCRTSEAQSSTEIEAVVDVPYGDDYTDLVPFLETLVESTRRDEEAQHRQTAIGHIAQVVSDTSLVARELNDAGPPSLNSLIVDPILLPVPHEQFSNRVPSKSHKDQLKPVTLDDVISEGKLLLVAGEANSGVSTALAWLATEAAVALNAHPVIIENPLRIGKHPVQSEVQRVHKYRGVSSKTSRDILALDNFRLESSKKFDAAFSDIATLGATMTIIGVPESDAMELSTKFKSAGIADTQVVYLGRFGERETVELANLLTEGNGEAIAKQALSAALEKHLPRTPFTLALLIELIRTGINPGEGDTETWLLSRYIDFLLEKELFEDLQHSVLTVRNKRAVLEAIARKLVMDLSDEAPIEDLERCADERVQQLGWDSSGRAIVSDFISRRILTRSSNGGVRFLRSSYLELMAGEVARRDAHFREHILSNPLQLASICCAYVSVSRDDLNALTRVSTELERIPFTPPKGSAFGKVRKTVAREDHSLEEVEAEASSNNLPETDGISDRLEGMSLLPPDTDPPAYLKQSFDELSAAKQSMLVVDLVSRVLRDSDEVEDQNFKADIAKRLLLSWVGFVDSFEGELSSLSVDFQDDEAEISQEEAARLRPYINRITPLFAAVGGITSCLMSPRMRVLVENLEFDDPAHRSYGLLLRTIALWTLGGSAWTRTLEDLPDEAVETFCGNVFVQGLAWQSYVEDSELGDADLSRILNFVRRCAVSQYEFSGPGHRNAHFNRIERNLRSSRLNHQRKAAV